MIHRLTTIARIATVAVIAAAILASFVTPALAAPRAVNPFGMNSHMLWGYSNADIDREMDLLQAAGSGWLRLDIDWSVVEPSKGTYNTSRLAKLDYVVAQAAAHNIQVAPVVIAVPLWANGNTTIWTPPTNDADFADFMKYLAGRYKGKITYWELGNEVNESGFWATGRNPARYTKFLKQGYIGTKAGNPDAKVITAGLAGADYNYVSEMYQAGAKGYFDILGIHPYTNGRSPYAEDTVHPGWVYSGMARVKAVMDSYGDADKTIWATEIGWQTSTVNSFVTESQKSQFIYDTYKRTYEEYPYVTTVFIYGLRDDGTNPDAAIDNYGLVKRDYTKKPSFASFRKAYDDFQVPAVPAPVVEPAPAPVVEPTAAPIAEPVTTTPVPVIDTTPAPVSQPTPTPTPTPAPAPAPAPVTQPAPAPIVVSDPAPAPVTAPVVEPVVDPAPATDPAPTVEPTDTAAPATPTTISAPAVALTATAKTVSIGQAATLKIAVTPAQMAQLVIESRVAGATLWSTVATLATGTDGKAISVVVPEATAEYRVTTDDGRAISNVIKIGVKAKATVKVSRSSVRSRGTVTISGIVMASTVSKSGVVSSKARVRVFLQRKIGSKWVTIRRINPGENRRFSSKVKVVRRGLRHYRVYCAAGDGSLPATSNTVALRVR